MFLVLNLSLGYLWLTCISNCQSSKVEECSGTICSVLLSVDNAGCVVLYPANIAAFYLYSRLKHYLPAGLPVAAATSICKGQKKNRKRTERYMGNSNDGPSCSSCENVTSFGFKIAIMQQVEGVEGAIAERVVAECRVRYYSVL